MLTVFTLAVNQGRVKSYVSWVAWPNGQGFAIINDRVASTPHDRAPVSDEEVVKEESCDKL